jgi:predicted MPP superfamily phosphohydrolase
VERTGAASQEELVMRISRIAHFSDLHMLARRPGKTRLGVRILSFGRPLDLLARVRKVKMALDAARRACADHIVVSGDLTESGSMDEFESLAEVLDGEINPDRITLVPGNHDAYESKDAWKKALEGPLRAYARTSATEPGKMLELEGLSLLPLDVTCHQPITRSAGHLEDDAADVVARRLHDSKSPVAIVQHHPPFAHAMGAWQWVDGLRGHKRLMAMLEAHPEAHVLHGHLHHVVDRGVCSHRPRIFGAPAVVEDESGARVRMYQLRGGELQAAGLVA